MEEKMKSYQVDGCVMERRNDEEGSKKHHVGGGAASHPIHRWEQAHPMTEPRRRRLQMLLSH